jgi:hypothetical protein
MDRNTVNYKALAFIADQTASTFHYEVKGVRALWDPSLSIPGTNRRGGWRCPLGTRFGGQITDRYGRSCGWGVARRLANGIADIGERLESIDDRKRNARVAKRNARVARQLARDVKPGLLERGARGIADALDGGGNKPVRKPKFDRPRIGGIRRAEQQGATVGRIAEQIDRPPSRPRTPDSVPVDATLIPKPARKPRKRGNLRDSEARRMERELVQPGAPRTGEAPAQPPQPPPPNRPKAPRARRRDVSNQGAARSVRRVPTENDVPEAPPARPIVPAQRSRPPQPPARPKPQAQISAQPPQPPARPKPESRVLAQPPQPPVKVPATAKSFDLAKEFENASEAEKKQVQEALAKINSKKRDAQDNMKLWGNSNIEQLERHVESQKQEMQRMDNQLNVMLDGWNRNKDNPQMREGAMVALIRAHEYRETHKNNLEAMEGRVNELRGGKPAPVQPREPKQPPQPPKTPERPSVIDVKPASVKSDYRQEKIGALGEDGLPDIVAVPKGNKGMDTQEQANEFVRRRGELADVPDEFLGEALRQNSTGNNPRFQQKRLDAHGVNANREGNMVKYEDARNGKTYYLKYALAPQTANEDLHEVMGNNIAGRMGMPVGQIRFDGVARDGQHRAILFEDVRNYMDGEVVSPGDGKRIVNGDKVRATLLDFAIVNVDRHGNNFFGVNQNGVIRFAAIDPSLGFDAEWHGKVFKNIEPNESGLRRWLNHDRGGGRNEMLSNLRKDFNEGRMHRDEVVAVVAEIQKSMREAEAKNAYRSFAKKAQKAASVGGWVENRYGDADNYIVNKPDERMKFIADINPSRLADIILGR